MDARSLDPDMLLGCPWCPDKMWSTGVPSLVVSWRGVPARSDGKDHHQQATNTYLKHLEARHGMTVSDLEWGHLPIVVDSPQTLALH